MIRVRFTGVDGPVDLTGAEGDRLLDVARDAGQPLEGTCDGDLACATCHVVIAPAWFALLPPAGGDEEDMLDLAPGATRHSRLSCQIRLAAPLDGIEVKLPT